MKGLAGGIAAVVLVGATVVGAGVALSGTSQDDPDAGGLSSAVPAEYQPWIERAGSMCPEISPALVAAQIDAESGWRPDAVSPAGAKGLSQFMDSTWPTWGKDDDENGEVNQFDPGDAIMAQGRFDCWNVNRLKGAAEGEQLIRLVLAAYNAGPYSVLHSSCKKADKKTCTPTIPQIPETLAYIDRILGLIPKYEDADPAGNSEAAGASGRWVQPISESYMVGAVFKQRGSSWAWLGWHTGYDYSVGIGTNIKAISAGTITHAAPGSESGGTGGSYGHQVIIDHGPDENGHQVQSYYAHLAGFAVAKGDKVKAGQLIGTVGMTGNTRGAHLHLEVTVKDPAKQADQYFVDPHAYIKDRKQKAPKQPDPESTGNGAAAVVDAIKQQLGKPYSLGGGNPAGPTTGLDGRVGWDCSSLVQHAWHKGAGIRIPRTTWDQADKLDKIPMSEIHPGDLIFFKSPTAPGGGWNHVGLYIGDGQMIHAPNPRKTVEKVSITNGHYAGLDQTARRPR